MATDIARLSFDAGRRYTGVVAQQGRVGLEAEDNEARTIDVVERRAELVKRFLAEQGIPDANIETRAIGKTQQLSAEQVKQLMEQDSNLTAQDREQALQKRQRIDLAYNRRVDFTVSTTGQESARVYPFNTKDYARLVDRGGPKKEGTVELAAQREKIKK